VKLIEMKDGEAVAGAVRLAEEIGVDEDDPQE
jgi:hypothetical protein